jgi:hypothetical protein
VWLAARIYPLADWTPAPKLRCASPAPEDRLTKYWA